MRRTFAIFALMSFSALPAASLAQGQAGAQKPVAGKFTLDTPIEVLIADARARRVLETHIPRLLSHPQFNNVKARNLRQIQSFTNGRLTDATLKRIETDLAAIR